MRIVTLDHLGETRVALYEGDRPVELHLERWSERSSTTKRPAENLLSGHEHRARGGLDNPSPETAYFRTAFSEEAAGGDDALSFHLS